MLYLDIRTIALLITLASFLQAIMMILCYITTARYLVLAWWVGGGIVNAVGWFLLLLQGMLPDGLSIAVANICLVFATAMLHQGVYCFLDLRSKWQEWIMLASLVVCCVGFVLFTSIVPSVAARTILISPIVAIISGVCAWNLWRITSTKLRLSARANALIMTLYSLWFVFRLVATLLDPEGATLFGATLLQTATFLITLSGILLWTPGLMLMVVQRLHTDLASAQEVEHHMLEVNYQHILAGEQLFRQTFDQSPFGAAILDMQFRFVRINSMLATLVSQNDNDLLGVDLADVIHPDDRHSGLAQMQQVAAGYSPQGILEQRWLRWDGDTIWVQFSARLLQRNVDTEPTVLMQLINITVRKQIERDLRQRIDEMVSLNRITQVLAGWTSLQESLKSVATEIQSLFDSAVIGIWVYEGEHTLRRLISLHTDQAHTAPHLLAISQSRLAQRLRNRETVLLIEPTDDPLIVTGDGPEGEGDARCVLLVPLVTRGQSLGVMRLCASQPDRVYTPADVALMQTIAVPIATAIDNARLLTQVQTSAAEAERRRLGRELHDSVSQALFAAHRVAEVLPRLWELDPEEGRMGLQEIRRLTGSALAEMRALLLELRPQVLRDTPLHVALPYLLHSLAAHEVIHLDVQLDDVPVLPAEVQIALYRIAQEALNNISKHAHARQVIVRLNAQPANSPEWYGEILLSMSDDGRGFNPKHISPGRFGLTSLYERANEIGATLRVESNPYNGTCITVMWRGFSAEAQPGTYALQALSDEHNG